MIRSIFVLLTGILSYSAMCLSAVGQTISGMEISKSSDSTDIVLKSDGPMIRQILYQGSVNYPAIIVHLPDVDWEVNQEKVSRGGDIRRITWSEQAVVIKLTRPMSVSVFELRPDEQDARFRTVLKMQRTSPEDFRELVENYKAVVEALKLPNMYDLTDHAPRPIIKPNQHDTGAGLSASIESASSANEPKESKLIEAEEAENLVTDVVPQFLKDQKKDLRKVIVIDPGHGGKDPGALQHGAIEKDIVIDVAHKMRDILSKNRDYVIYLTRDGDEFIGLEDRLKFARDVNANLFISLHADAAASPVASGASVFTLSSQGQERSEDIIETNNWTLHDNLAVNQPSNSVLDELWKRQTKNLSPLLAEKVIDELEEIIPMTDYPLRHAGYYVLLDMKAPAVLVELGYLSNILDARRLTSPEFRTEAAEAITRAIDSYFEYVDALVSTE